MRSLCYENQFSFILKLELIIITKISHLNSLWKRDWGELGHGLSSKGQRSRSALGSSTIKIYLQELEVVKYKRWNSKYRSCNELKYFPLIEWVFPRTNWNTIALKYLSFALHTVRDANKTSSYLDQLLSCKKQEVSSTDITNFFAIQKFFDNLECTSVSDVKSGKDPCLLFARSFFQMTSYFAYSL